MREHSKDWHDGYRAARYEGVTYCVGKSPDWVSGWLIGHRDRHDDEIMDSFDDSWAE